MKNKNLSLSIDKEKVLNFIKNRNESTFVEIAKQLKISPKQNKQLTNILNDLIKANKIEKYKDKYRFILFLKRIEANISIATKRFGFIDFENSETSEKRSAFLAPFQLNGALDKDLLLVDIFEYKNENGEILNKANIIKNISHQAKSVIGFIEFKGKIPKFKAFDDKDKAEFYFLEISKIPKDISPKQIVKCNVLKPNLDKVVIQFDSIVSSLEESDYPIKKIISQNDINIEFNNETIKQARMIPQIVTQQEIEQRRDLRNLLTVTIDGLDTKDFDDAISCYQLENGNYKLFIHIADVSYYVKENDEIDKEALKRGTSIYLPDKVIPMLPFELSNGICSLNPKVDRACLTLELEINNIGQNVNIDIYQSVINSDYRLTYNEVNELFQNKKVLPDHISNLLFIAKDISKILRRTKEEAGYVDFEIKEAKLIIENNKVVDIKIKEEGESEKLIEDFMVRANETVAQLMLDKNLPSIYRIHDKPDSEKLMNLKEIVAFIGLKDIEVPFDGSPKTFRAMVQKIKQEKFDDYIKMSLLRTMQKAIYSSKNIGHFGLASTAYSHFTSPIRRYPDLLLHRLIRKYIFENNYKQENHDEELEKISKIAEMNSESEVNAMSVERDVVDIRRTEFFNQFINKTFEATVSGIEKFGAFFVIEEYQASVLIRYEELNDNVIKLNNFEAKGNKIKLKVGEKYLIRITSIDKEKGNINATLV
ncbi:ribonuclease R [[Mycoplasma] anseris]|uniref:Ribonuclease R n=1 Tax=[Mycoplasma] anseris TaxID=92400 RepID=A0A2Z4NCD7_9BACT|nr:ribonuclease R [[Mycoplasma] anseris]AWX69220.1 ribonuclease R [[Mycoplasma] anseris]